MDLPPAIYAEDDVPAYLLPDLSYREKMIEDLTSMVYGRIPPLHVDQKSLLIENGRHVGPPSIDREQWRITIRSGEREASFDLLLYLPADATEPIPVSLGLTFFGNHTVCEDPAVVLPSSWCPLNEGMVVIANRATASRSRCKGKPVAARACHRSRLRSRHGLLRRFRSRLFGGMVEWRIAIVDRPRQRRPAQSDRRLGLGSESSP